MAVPHKDVSVSDLEDGKKVISELRPNWAAIKTKVFDGGITNKLIGYIDETCQDKSEMILIRIYGNNTDVIIDRKRELATHVKLNKHGFASPVYCSLNNGYVYGFVEGDVLNVESVRHPDVAPLVARAMARMHCNVPTENSEPVYYPTLCSWIEKLPAEVNSSKMPALKDTVFNKIALKKELDSLNSKIMGNKKLKIGFCHNDLLLGNVIHNASKQSVSFIDFEYGNCNYISHDIGDHFVEYAGIENVDFSLYPDEPYQRWWLRIYLEEFNKEKNLGEVSEQDVDTLYNEVNFFSACAHFWWAVWAVIQELNSEIDFGFADYGRMKLEEYYKSKEKYYDLI